MHQLQAVSYVKFERNRTKKKSILARKTARFLRLFLLLLAVFALFGYNMDGLRHVPPIRTGMGAVESVTKTSFNLNPMSAERRSRLTRLTHLFFPVATQPRNRLGAALLMGRSCYFCFKNGLIKLNMKYLIGYSVYHARSDNNILGMNL